MNYEKEKAKYLASLDEADRRDKERRRQFQDRHDYLDHLFHPLTFNPKEEKPKIPWLVEGLIPRGYLAILAGDPKEGKTCLATAIALAIATGNPFAGHKTTQSGVLWLSFEESPEERAQILAHAPEQIKTHQSDYPIAYTFDKEVRGGYEPQPVPKSSESPITNPESRISELPLYTCYNPFPIDTEDGILTLAHWVKESQAGLIVVDPLHAAHSGRSLTDGWAARKTLKLLKAFCAQHQVTALVLHHLGKSGRSRRVAESAQLSASASMFMLLERTPSSCARPQPNKSQRADSAEEEGAGGGGARAFRNFNFTSRGRGDFANQTLHLRSRNPLHYQQIKPQQTTTKKRPVDQIVLGALKTRQMTTKQIIEQLALVPQTVSNAITRLLKIGAIKTVGRRQGKRLYQVQNPTR